MKIKDFELPFEDKQDTFKNDASVIQYNNLNLNENLKFAGFSSAQSESKSFTYKKYGKEKLQSPQNKKLSIV
jgi:hypothetical protein